MKPIQDRCLSLTNDIDEAAVSDAENEESTEDELSNLMENDSTDDANLAKWEEKNPLFRYLIPAFYTGNDGRQYPSEGASVGMAKIRDTAMVNKYMAEVSSSFPRNARFAWTSKPESGALIICHLLP